MTRGRCIESACSHRTRQRKAVGDSSLSPQAGLHQHGESGCRLEQLTPTRDVAAPAWVCGCVCSHTRFAELSERLLVAGEVQQRGGEQQADRVGATGAG